MPTEGYRGRVHKVRLRQRLRITAPRNLCLSEHGGIASHLLIEPESVPGPVHEGIEPEEAHESGRDGVGERIVALEVSALVRQDEPAFSDGEASIEVARHHNLWTPPADEHGLPRGRAPVGPIGPRLQAAKRSHHEPLTVPEARECDRGADAPNQRDAHSAAVDRRTEECIRTANRDGGSRQEHRKEASRQKQPQPVSRFGTHRPADRLAQRDHDEDTERPNNRQPGENREDLIRHRPTPRSGA